MVFPVLLLRRRWLRSSLLQQLDQAGIKVDGAEDMISEDAKHELLTHLRRSHGHDESQGDAAPRKIERVEAPRGEVVYSVSWKENSRTPSRVHARPPTYVNMPAVRWMVLGARVADAPLIQASIDPCYSCTDR